LRESLILELDKLVNTKKIVIKSLRENVDECLDDNNKLKVETKNKDAEIKDMSKKNSIIIRENQSLMSDVVTLKEEVCQASSMIENQTEKILNMEMKNSDLKSKVVQIQREADESQFIYKEKLKALEKELQISEDKFGDIKTENSALNNLAESMKAIDEEKFAFDQKNKDLEDELLNRNKELLDLKAIIEKQMECSVLKSSSSSIADELDIARFQQLKTENEAG
jgi:chromosome segregation ATPase